MNTFHFEVFDIIFQLGMEGPIKHLIAQLFSLSLKFFVFLLDFPSM
jgi:hypothetical protein